MLPGHRMKTLVQLTLTTLALTSLACASSGTQKAPGSQTASTKKKTEPLPCNPEGQTQDLRTADVDGDGVDDVYKYYEELDDPERPGERKRSVVRQDLDLNWDGRFDVCRFFDVDGFAKREELDLDFDGKVDEWRTYERGVIVKSERDRNNDGRPDIIRRYKDGKLVQKDSDTNNDGQVDRWEYYSGNKLDRIGVDMDHDGKVDRWSKSSS